MRGLATKEKPGLGDLALQFFFYTAHKLRQTVYPFALADLRPLWRDYSYHNGLINVAIAAANGVWGGFGRAGISWGYQDPTFARFWDQFGYYNLYRSSYHVIHTNQPIIPQANNWYMVHSERDVIPRMIDLEVDNGDSWSSKANAVWNMSEIVLQRDGVRPIIYSRYLLVNSWLSSWTTSMLNEHKWMMAQYLSDPTKEHPGPPTPPNRVDPANILWHQSADTFPGFPGEVSNLAADRDRWQQGNESQMHFMIRNLWGEPEPPPEEIMSTLLVRSTKIVPVADVYPSNTVVITVPENEVWSLKHLAVHVNRNHSELLVQIKAPSPDEINVLTLMDQFAASIAQWHSLSCDLELSTGYRIEAQVIGIDINGKINLAVGGTKTVLPA